MKIKSIYCLLIAMMLACIVNAQTTTRVQDIKAIDIAQVLDKQKNMVILDIRTKAEFQEFSLPGSVNIDSLDKQFEENLAALVSRHPNIRSWMVYCRSGNRSARAMPVLQKTLPGTIYHIKDGLRAYPQ